MNKIQIYIGEENPSLRELSIIASMIEGVLFLSGIYILNEKKKNLKYGTNEYEQVTELLYSINNSFFNFIKEKYYQDTFEIISKSNLSQIKPDQNLLLLFLLEKNKDNEFINSKLSKLLENIDFYKHPESIINENARNKARFDENSSFTDIIEWVHQHHSNSLITIESINTTNSIEAVIEVAQLVAILGLQEYNLTKDLVAYGLTMIQAYLGKKEGKKEEELKPLPNNYRLPRLPKSYIALLEKYNKIELTINEGGIKINLER